MPQAIYITGLLISSTILLVAYLNYRRKSGIKIRGLYSTASSVECNDTYVSQVAIENQKDRSVSVYGIYLQIGYAYHIEIESFEDKPLILRSYETYSAEYGPIDHYEVSLYRVDFNKLMENRNIRKRLVLSTSEGRYVAKRPIRRWLPVVDFFRNHYAATARPIRASYKGRDLGGNVRYVVEFASEDGKEEVVPILPGDFRVRKFRSFTLTKDSLESKESLERFLNELRLAGTIACSKVTVHDVEEWRERSRDGHPPIKDAAADSHGAIQYYILGPFLTWWSNQKMKRENKRRARESRNS